MTLVGLAVLVALRPPWQLLLAAGTLLLLLAYWVQAAAGELVVASAGLTVRRGWRKPRSIAWPDVVELRLHERHVPRPIVSVEGFSYDPDRKTWRFGRQPFYDGLLMVAVTRSGRRATFVSVELHRLRAALEAATPAAVRRVGAGWRSGDAAGEKPGPAA